MRRVKLETRVCNSSMGNVLRYLGITMFMLSLGKSPAVWAANEKKAESFDSRLIKVIENLHSSACRKEGLRGSLSNRDDLNRIASNIASGVPQARAEKDAHYRPFRQAVIQMKGHKSIPSINAHLSKTLCKSIRNGAYTSYGVGGTQSNVVIILSIPFVAHLDLEAVRSQVLGLVNEAREKGVACGDMKMGAVSPLRLNDGLNIAAQTHAEDMASLNYYGHNSLDGRTPGNRIKGAGYFSRKTGENIAAAQQSSAQVVEGWLQSPGHCRNIMDPDFKELGVGVKIDLNTDKGVYWVQTFGSGR
jgi:uncharacterized protein YkwD